MSTATFTRTSGILLHPTSLPSPYGIGDMGIEAYEFIDFLQDNIYGRHCRLPRPVLGILHIKVFLRLQGSRLSSARRLWQNWS